MIDGRRERGHGDIGARERESVGRGGVYSGITRTIKVCVKELQKT
jgi:hypothetical protein